MLSFERKTRRNARVRSVRRTAPVRLETLEDRCLLALATPPLIAEFAIPTASVSPWEIAAGPDGNLWFTETDRQQDRRDQPDDRRHHRVHHPDGQLPAPSGSRPGPTATSGSPRTAGNKIGEINPTAARHHRVRGPDRRRPSPTDRRRAGRQPLVHRA